MSEEEQKILGYAPEGDEWKPIYPTKRGWIYTQAFVMCSECMKPIRAQGGPIIGALCVECYGEVDGV